MPSFDIVSKVDAQVMDNIMNIVRKEYVTRFDFKDTKTEITFNKKDLVINITTENEMRLNSLIDILRARMIKQNVNPTCIDLSKEHYASGLMVKQELKIKQGVDKDTSRKIMADIKALKTKATAQVMDETIRVTSKSINELQLVLQTVRSKDYDLPLQIDNMK
ncbi:MAG: YajQ family cyclic di-GMP-binding protein [Bacteroidia bacterium]|jgi:uncharacterized protein YajQ (UPF0234 family)